MKKDLITRILNVLEIFSYIFATWLHNSEYGYRIGYDDDMLCFNLIILAIFTRICLNYIFQLKLSSFVVVDIFKVTMKKLKTIVR